ncbi:MAG: hypothetical protein JKY01_00175 [Pseudomonadales bacterium]|nr:hypothetical protein [Pseudomonadales bacterium]
MTSHPRLKNAPTALQRLLSYVLLGSLFLATSSSLHAETEDSWDDEWGESESEGNFSINHRVETGFGSFIHNNNYVEEDNSLAEIRYRFDMANYWGETLGSLKADITADDVAGEMTVSLREAIIALPLAEKVDVRVGRQILTWGTGDLLFLNDLFPKDWVAFFSGRPMEYLKAPSDAVKISIFNTSANIDIVWTPIFNADEYLNGERFSFYNPLNGNLYGAPPKLSGLEPDEKFNNGELAIRLYQNINSQEWAIYGYRGFNKQPTAYNPSIMRPTFTKLQVLGASLRSPLAGGLFNTEFAWHYSLDDKEGLNPFTPNSQLRVLLAYEKEVISRLTASAQFYVENTLDYDALLSHSFNAEREAEEYRTLTTFRLSYRALQDKLMLSLFGYYSPSDKDHYWLPKVNYRLSDKVSFEFGGNFFGGDERYTFFGQLEDNSNIYARMRYDF